MVDGSSGATFCPIVSLSGEKTIPRFSLTVPRDQEATSGLVCGCACAARPSTSMAMSAFAFEPQPSRQENSLRIREHCNQAGRDGLIVWKNSVWSQRMSVLRRC